jgi:hypothetical protein
MWDAAPQPTISRIEEIEMKAMLIKFGTHNAPHSALYHALGLDRGGDQNVRSSAS